MTARGGLLFAVPIALLLASCAGTSTDVDDVPVAVAEPRTEAVDATSTQGAEVQVGPATGRGDEPGGSVSPVPADGPVPAEDGPVDGPSAADAAAFIATDAPEGAVGLDHTVVDLDDDGAVEVVSTAVVADVVTIRLAWWDGASFEVLATDTARVASEVEDVRVGDINRDGDAELLVTVAGGRSGIAVWSVPARGQLVRRVAVGGCHDGSHVYGVVGARVEARADAPAVLVATCDDTPLPVADWSEERYEWRAGAYRPAG